MNILKKLKTICNLPSDKERAISRALKCKGWTNENKLSLLYDLVKQTEILDGDILEIGSAWGRSTVLLGLATKKKIWSIDPHTGGIAYIRRGEVQNSFEDFQKNLKRNRVSKRVEIIKSSTSEAKNNNAISEEVVFSMVFIDGLHTAGGVEVDFNYAFSRLMQNGVMVFDDYFESTVSDYSEMINDLVQEHSVELIKDNESRLAYYWKNTGGKESVPMNEPSLLHNTKNRYIMHDIGFHGDAYLLNFVDHIIRNCSYFIETGANVGSTLVYVARQYPDINCLSCEPDKMAYVSAVENIAQHNNVTIYNECSQNFMLRLEMSNSKMFEENIIFWLDAHGYGFNWPLKHEIDFITNKFKSAYIFIDDFKVPGLDCFGYDLYENQECSYEFIKDSMATNRSYNLYYPCYTEKTSKHHPLRGWVLIEYGHDGCIKIPETLRNKISHIAL